MNYSGDTGQVIRQLIASNVLRRVAMCCMSSPLSGKRQHLAVSHEKGKVTILQLSALLKQADSSKRKLTLTVGTLRYSNENKKLFQLHSSAVGLCPNSIHCADYCWKSSQ